MKDCKSLTIFLSLVTALFILSAAIAIPILFRPFYYFQIVPLGLEEHTEWSREEIITAYDEMLDFCVGLEPEFSTGVLRWSESGKSHFVDVRGMFHLDFAVFVVSAAILLFWKLIQHKTKREPYRFRNHGYGFWGSIVLILCFFVIGVLAAANFDRAFTVFHMIFFPGKDNWIFDTNTDQIIQILPEVFFRNCAILILAFLVLFCGIFIFSDLHKRKENARI